jgi:hypothetical protein
MPQASTCARPAPVAVNRLDLRRIDLLDRLVEQLADEADRAQPDRDREHCPKGGDVDRVPHRPPELVHIGPARREGAVQQIGGLARRIPHEGPDRLVADELEAQRRQRDTGEPAEPGRQIRRRGAPRPDLRAVAIRGHRHHCTARLMNPLVYSQTITIAMMISRIAAEVPNS